MLHDPLSAAEEETRERPMPAASQASVMPIIIRRAKGSSKK